MSIIVYAFLFAMLDGMILTMFFQRWSSEYYWKTKWIKILSDYRDGKDMSRYKYDVGYSDTVPSLTKVGATQEEINGIMQKCGK